MIETSTQLKRIEINGQVFTPDFAKMYDDLLAKSIANLDNLHSTSSTAYEKFVSTMKKEYNIDIIGLEFNFSLSGFLSEIAEVTTEDSINELVDNLSTNVKRQLGLDDYTYEHDFRNELIKEVREGLVSIAF